MSNTNDGGPAFPNFGPNVIVDPKGERIIPELTGGMSLRDYFAGQTLIGLLPLMKTTISIRSETR